jgi:hypothetical protein
MVELDAFFSKHRASELLEINNHINWDDDYFIYKDSALKSLKQSDLKDYYAQFIDRDFLEYIAYIWERINEDIFAWYEKDKDLYIFCGLINILIFGQEGE